MTARPKTLAIGKNFTLPLDLVTQSTAILARKGAGKTYTAMVMTEELLAVGLDVVVLDPLGVWWGLRSSADGTKNGLPITILGGEYGDVPLEPTGGKVIAELVAEVGGSYVLDMSDFASKAAQDRFAADFAERIFRAKSKNTTPVHLMIDEADSFAPQKPQKGQERMLGAFEEIVRRGRVRGLGTTLISQRAAVINKNVLTQTECMIALQVTGPQDRAAIDDWIRGNASESERRLVLDSLASLERGEAWFWSPSWLRTLEKVEIREKLTFDSSRTPTAGEAVAVPKKRAAVDLEALRSRMAETIEKADANDPAKLRKRIRELESQVAGHRCAEPKVERIEIPALDPALADRLLDAVETMNETAREVSDQIAGAFKTMREAKVPSLPSIPPISIPPIRNVVVSPTPEVGTTDVDAVGISTTEVTIGKGERTVLDVLSQWPEGRTPNELAFLAGYSAKASTLRNILARLRAAGFVEKGTPIRLTPEGIEAAGGYQLRPTGPALLEHWRNHSKMGEGERRVLDVLVDAYPNALSNEELCERAGYSPVASTVRNILARLRSLGIVSKSERRLDASFAEAIAA